MTPILRFRSLGTVVFVCLLEFCKEKASLTDPGRLITVQYFVGLAQVALALCTLFSVGFAQVALARHSKSKLFSALAYSQLSLYSLTPLAFRDPRGTTVAVLRVTYRCKCCLNFAYGSAFIFHLCSLLFVLCSSLILSSAL